MKPFIPAPFGNMPDEVVDPERLAGDMVELHRIAQRTTQHQWAEDAFSDERHLKVGHPVRIRFSEVEAHLYQEVFNGAVANPDTENPILRNGIVAGATPDPNLFQIPFNRGLNPVPDPRVEWNTPFPELVWVIADYQYVRERDDQFGTPEEPKDYFIRAKIRIGLDGVTQAGAGPDAVPVNSRYRGAGYRRRSNRSNITWMGLIPAGSHVVQLYAGQAWTADSPNSEVAEMDEEMGYHQDPPTTGVCLGHRRLIVISFPFGLLLGS
jgi:hypothetical protein